MVRLLARVVGIGIETADMLVNEVLSRPLRDRRAGGALRRPDGCAGRERRQAAGTRACQSRQCPGPPWDDPTRLALPAVSKEQRTGPVVPGPHGRSPWRHAQNNDRRLGAQAAHRTLAICHHWRAIRRRDPASGKLTKPQRELSRANLRSQSRSAIGGYPVSVKAEPIEETKESGIILVSPGRGQRLNNCAAILRSEKRGGTGTIPAEESSADACWSRWCGCRSRQPARDALGRADGSRRAPRRRVLEGLNLTLGIRTAMAPVSMNFGPQNCGAVPGCLPRPGAARMVEDYYDFPMGPDF